MPIYEYFCDTCQDKFDVLRPFSKADAPAVCPTCQSSTDRRLLSMFACASKDGGESESHAIAGTSGCGGCAGRSCSGCKH